MGIRFFGDREECGDVERDEELRASEPGQRGTLRLVEKYGKLLLCVRYRYDEIRGVKLKTVEIIVDEKPVRHPRFNGDDIVPLSAFDETELREALK